MTQSNLFETPLDPALAGRRVQPISTAFVSGCLRLFDLSVIGLLGAGIYFAYGVYPEASGVESEYVVAVLIAMTMAAVLFQWFGVYAEEYIFSRTPRFDRVLTAWVVICGALLATAFAVKISDMYSRVWSVGWMVSVFIVLGFGRGALAHWVATLAREGRFASRTVIVGAGENGQRLSQHLQQYGDVCTQLVGFIDDRRNRIVPPADGLPVLGDTDHLIRLIRSNLVDQVFIAVPWSAESRLRTLVQRLALTPVRIRLAPDLAGLHFADRSFTQVAGLPMLHLFDRPISGWSHVLKAIEDRTLALLALLFFAPALAIIALAVKLDSPGPIFFKQRRYGFNNKLIEVWKFRTMRVDMNDANCEIQTTRGDPRVTRVGALLRKTSLDEFPQLLNVLRGDMSIVGPRPHALATKAEGRLFEEVVDRYAARHRVKPGITGWAQVNGWRGETDTIEKIQKRVEYDLYYIDNWSVWLDLVIIAKTLFVLLGDENAY